MKENEMDEPEVFFILTSDGRIGIGDCPDKEAGGSRILKWLPDEMLQEAANLRCRVTIIGTSLKGQS